MKMKNNISFYPRSSFDGIRVPPPRPAKEFYPDFLKRMPNKVVDENNKETMTAVRCVPFIDSFTSGYIQELACDIEIKYDGNFDGADIISYSWPGGYEYQPLSTRLEDRGEPNLFPKFPGFYNVDFHWNTVWEPRTPPGFSMMYHHPSNRFDLPFHTMTGIIDTDMWTVSGPLPFLIKEGFEGIIPAGTPIYQMTPIKRNTWVSKSEQYDEAFTESMNHKVRRFFDNGYRKAIWQKKSFN
jgi:hypothetical protein